MTDTTISECRPARVPWRQLCAEAWVEVTDPRTLVELFLTAIGVAGIVVAVMGVG